VFTTRAPLRAGDWRRAAYRRPRKDAAPGSAGVTAAASAAHLEAHLTALYERRRRGRYTAAPVKRTWLDKEDGSQRPMGMPACEDTLVQRAVTMRWGAV
jgi:RNA-directed DNA polymerase